jgi:hypothetical protein
MGQPVNTTNINPCEPSQRTYATLCAELARSARECAVFDRSIEIAGWDVQLQLVGDQVAAWIDPPLTHLASKARGPSPRLTIHLFRRDSNDSETADHVATSTDGRFLRQRVGACDYLLDRTERRLIGSIGSLGEIPAWELVKPLSVPLTTWLSDDGLSLIHAGLVSLDGEGVLFAGPSGAGKSTCALACAVGGFDFLGDDCIIFDLPTPQECIGYSLYSTSALDAAHLEKFASPPLVQATTGTASRGKKLIAMNGAEHVQTVRQSRIRAIVLPRLTHAPRSVIRPAAKGEALRILAPSSIIKRAVPASRTLSRLAALVNLVPSYWLDMSHKPADIPPTIAPLLTE